MASRSARASLPRRLLTEAGLLAAIGAAVLLDSRGYPPSLTEGAPARPSSPGFSQCSSSPARLGSRSVPGARGGERLRRRISRWIRRWTFPRKRCVGHYCGLGTFPRKRFLGVCRGLGSQKPDPTPGRRDAVAWIAAFLLVWPRLGTVLSVPLLVVGLMWLTGERSWRALVSVPLAFAGFIYLVFMSCSACRCRPGSDRAAQGVPAFLDGLLTALQPGNLAALLAGSLLGVFAGRCRG